MPGYNLQQAQPAGFFAGHELKSLLEDGRKLESMSLRLDKFSDPRGRNKKANIESALALQGRAIHRSPLAIPGSVQVEMKLKSRLIVNQAGGILENAGLCIHKHFNCPYVPGSAVKGVSRRMAFQNIFDASTIDEKVDLVCKTALVFGWGDMAWRDGRNKDGEFHSDFEFASGSDFAKVRFAASSQLSKLTGVDMQKDFDQDQPWKSLPCFAGLVSFLPSFPKTTCRLVLDIVNCHHMDYYGADDDAATAMDNENPNPQFFPAVESGSIFLFSIAPVARAYFLGAESLGFNPMDFAVESLKRGLSSNGIGAKTAAGYGWFEQVQK